MELKNLFSKESSFFQQKLSDKTAVINFLAWQLLKSKKIKDEKQFINAINIREKQGSTNVGDGIAMPHALNPTVIVPGIAFVSLADPIIWDPENNQKIDLVFMIITSGENSSDHLNALADLSKYLLAANNQKLLRSAKSFSQLIKVFNQKEEKKSNYCYKK